MTPLRWLRDFFLDLRNAIRNSPAPCSSVCWRLCDGKCTPASRNAARSLYGARTPFEEER